MDYSKIKAGSIWISKDVKASFVTLLIQYVHANRSALFAYSENGWPYNFSFNYILKNYVYIGELE